MSRDDDTFAVLAQSWDSGILPYRDIHAYNFPGQTYLFWVLGKTLGWGCPVAVRGIDSVCVVLAGAMAIGWSRRRLGGALPGLIGYVAFLNKYLDLPVESTGERDWYTAFLACAGIAILEMRPGRWARLSSSLLAALAFTIRPQAVLFMPALVSAVCEDPRVIDLSFGGRMRVAVIWCLTTALFVALAFAPVFVAGVGGDFVRSLGVVAYGGPYSKTNGAGGHGTRRRIQFLEDDRGPGRDRGSGDTTKARTGPHGPNMVTGVAGGAGLPSDRAGSALLFHPAALPGELDGAGDRGVVAAPSRSSSPADPGSRRGDGGLRVHAGEAAPCSVCRKAGGLVRAGPRRDDGHGAHGLPASFYCVCRPAVGSNGTITERCSPTSAQNQPANACRQLFQPISLISRSMGRPAGFHRFGPNRASAGWLLSISISTANLLKPWKPRPTRSSSGSPASQRHTRASKSNASSV